MFLGLAENYVCSCFQFFLFLIAFYLFCMHALVWVRMCLPLSVCAYVCVCVCVCVSRLMSADKLLVLSWVNFTFWLHTESLSLVWTKDFRLRWVAGIHIPPTSPLPSLSHKCDSSRPSSYMGSGKQNSSPHARQALYRLNHLRNSEV